jgi:hypothetical protein
MVNQWYRLAIASLPMCPRVERPCNEKGHGWESSYSLGCPGQYKASRRGAAWSHGCDEELSLSRQAVSLRQGLWEISPGDR